MKSGWIVWVGLVIIVIVLAGIALFLNQSKHQAYSVIVTSSNPFGTVGVPVNITWDIAGPAASTNHTAVHYGPSPLSSPSVSAYPGASVYQCTNSACSLPGSFTADLNISSPGTYYYRAHTVVNLPDGNKQEVWSDEKTINISGISVSTSAVSISNFAFSPATLTIPAGTRVTWTNNDSATHTVTADNGEFDTGSILPNGTADYSFNAPGTFAYHCALHPFMKATIIVQ